MCQKISYKSKTEAQADIKMISTQMKFRSKKFTRQPKANKKLRCYECPICGDWHLTTQKPRKLRRKK